jgi:arylsulfatase A-like enzyme
MNRRDFVKSAGAVAGAGLLSGPGVNPLLAQSNTAAPGPQPNILFLLVDELRFPSVFPAGITDVPGFLAKFMPNLYTLWQSGVKFGSHYTAANACTPARGTLISGLYSQQSWVVTTLLGKPTAEPSPVELLMPVLSSQFPTYGKLLRALGYTTPYCGKWHVSIPDQNNGGLEAYGFDYKLYPDPTGSNLQGTYGDESVESTNGAGQPITLIYHNDADTVDSAIQVMEGIGTSSQPFCLTVSLINPHDREFFPAGTEYQTVNDVFATQSLPQNTTYPGDGPQVPWDENALKSPPQYGYPELPPNWESQADWDAQNKPTTQTFIKDFSQLVWGGITEDSTQTTSTIVPYTTTGGTQYGVIKTPFSYWSRGLDSYTQIMGVVDQQIGRVLCKLNSLPKSVVQNTVIVFASDHGEYSGAHGLVQGKLGTVYEEAWHIPLIVVDPSGRFTNDIDTVRTGLTSSVDLLPLLASLGARGTNAWMTPELSRIYGRRHDMLSMLASCKAPGRRYVLHATDEIAPSYYNFNNAPSHVLGLRTQQYKLGVYAEWQTATSTIDPTTLQFEFYDYATQGGRMEMINTPSDPRAAATFKDLQQNIIPNELQALLPPSLLPAQVEAKVAHLLFRALIENMPEQTWTAGGLLNLLGYGGPF